MATLRQTFGERNMKSDSRPEDKDREKERQGRTVTLVGGLFNVILALFKGAVGLWTGSAALISGAVHSLSDLIGDGVVFMGVLMGGTKMDERHPYGHGKYETFATLGVALMLMAAGGGLAWESVQQILEIHANGSAAEPIPVEALGAVLITAIIKGILYRWSAARAERLRSVMLRAYALHHRIDALGSLAVGAGVAGAIFLGPKARILDPITALVVSFFIFSQGVSIAKGAVAQLLDMSVAREELEFIRSAVEEMSEFRELHALRARRVGSLMTIEMHVKVPPDMTVAQSDRLISSLENKLSERYGRELLVTVQVESEDRATEPSANLFFFGKNSRN